MSLTSHGNELRNQEIVQKERADEWIAEYREITHKYLSVSQVNLDPTNCYPSEVLFQEEKLLALERDMERCCELARKIKAADCFEWQVENAAGETRVFPRTYREDEVEVLRAKCAQWLNAPFGPAITFLRDNGQVCGDEDFHENFVFAERLNDHKGYVRRRKIQIMGTVQLIAANWLDALSQEKMLKWSSGYWIEVFTASVSMSKAKLFLGLLLLAPLQTVRGNAIAEVMREGNKVSLFSLTISPREIHEVVQSTIFKISVTHTYDEATDAIMALQEASLLDLNYKCAEDKGKTVLHKMALKVEDEFQRVECTKGFEIITKGFEIILACGADKKLRTQDGYTAHFFLFNFFERFVKISYPKDSKMISNYSHIIELLRV